MGINKAEPAGERNQGSAPVNPVRRKLVKGGAFVPPVILTLRHGAALAQTSAQGGACQAADQQRAQQTAPAALAPERDDWLRAPVLVTEVRRVRKIKGQWKFKPNAPVIQVYTHKPRGRFAWWSVKSGTSGKKLNYKDTHKTIQVVDDRGQVVHVGPLIVRANNPGLRYVGLNAEQSAFGLVAVSSEGTPVTDSDGNPLVHAVTPGDPNAGLVQNATNSCWASLMGQTTA